MTLEELLPPGVYPIWSPYDAFEAAAALMKALAEDEVGQGPGHEMPEELFRISSARRSAEGFLNG